jgi:hypothetical protein
VLTSGATGSGGGGGGAVTIIDGGNVVEGTVADAAVTGDSPGTINAHLRGIDKLLAAGLASAPITLFTSHTFTSNNESFDIDVSQLGSIVTYQSTALGGWDGHILVSGSPDGVTFGSAFYVRQDDGNSSNDISNLATGNPARLNVAGFKTLRLKTSGWTSGSATVLVGGSSLTFVNTGSSIYDPQTSNHLTINGFGAIGARPVDGSGTIIINTRTDGIAALDVADDMTSFEAFTQTLSASTDTTITFTQPVRLVKVKNFDTTNVIFVRDAAIASDTPSNAEKVGVAPATNVPAVEYFPFKTTTVHLRGAGASAVSVTGYF